MKYLEVEQKFYCSSSRKISRTLTKLGFKLLSETHEIDEYFTDIDSQFIQDRTCLRIRKTDNQNMELTFKGKSQQLDSFYAKAETNITISPKEYKHLANTLRALGFYSYVVIDKHRTTYCLKKDDLTYNVMIDTITNLDGFVEFEVIDKKNRLDYASQKLKELIADFSNQQLVVAEKPYRDFVAEQVVNELRPQSPLRAILFDLDGTLIDSEKAFFESFQQILSDNYNVKIDFSDYRKHELEKNANLLNYLKTNKKINPKVSSQSIMEKVYDNYSKKLSSIINDEQSFVNFHLIDKLRKLTNLKIGLVTTCRRDFVDTMLAKLSATNLFDVIITREDSRELKPHPEAYNLALRHLNLKPSQCLAIEDSPRGIKAAQSAGIKTIRVGGQKWFTSQRIMGLDSVVRFLLLIINCP